MAQEILSKIGYSSEILGEVIGELHGDKSALDKVVMYGSLASPMFAPEDVSAAIGLARPRDVSGYGRFEIETCKVHYVTTTVRGLEKRQVREMIMLTESGLYRFIYESRTPEAERFRLYVSIVLKQLRLQKTVSADSIQREYKELKSKYRLLEIDNEIVISGLREKLAHASRFQEIMSQSPMGSQFDDLIFIAKSAIEYLFYHYYVYIWDEEKCKAADFTPEIPYKEIGAYDHSLMGDTEFLLRITTNILKSCDGMRVHVVYLPKASSVQFKRDLEQDFSTGCKKIFKATVRDVERRSYEVIRDWFITEQRKKNKD